MDRDRVTNNTKLFTLSVFKSSIIGVTCIPYNKNEQTNETYNTHLLSLNSHLSDKFLSDDGPKGSLLLQRTT